MFARLLRLLWLASFSWFANLLLALFAHFPGLLLLVLRSWFQHLAGRLLTAELLVLAVFPGLTWLEWSDRPAVGI